MPIRLLTPYSQLYSKQLAFFRLWWDRFVIFQDSEWLMKRWNDRTSYSTLLPQSEAHLPWLRLAVYEFLRQFRPAQAFQNQFILQGHCLSNWSLLNDLVDYLPKVDYWGIKLSTVLRLFNNLLTTFSPLIFTFLIITNYTFPGNYYQVPLLHYWESNFT